MQKRFRIVISLVIILVAVAFLSYYKFSFVGNVISGDLQNKNSCSNLVAYYPFNGDVKDYSGNNYNGFINLSMLSYSSGRFDKGLSFNAGDVAYNYALAVPNATLDGKSKFSIGFYVKSNPPLPNRYSRNEVFLSVSAHKTQYETAEFDIEQKERLLRVTFNGDGLGHGYNAASRFIVDDGKWHYIVVTLDTDAGILQMFADGNIILRDDKVNQTRVDKPTNETKAKPIKASLVVLGQYKINGVYHDEAYGFRGQLDELAVYDKILAPEEVRKLWIFGGCGARGGFRDINFNCSESDGGINPGKDVMGASINASFLEEQSDLGDFGEYYCDKGNLSLLYIAASSSGIASPISPSSISGLNCILDSDKGDNPFVKGNVKVGGYSKGDVLEDSCVNENNRTNTQHFLQEYYCDNGKVNFTLHYCDFGCSDGKCDFSTEKDFISQDIACSEDTDGNDIYTEGVVLDKQKNVIVATKDYCSVYSGKISQVSTIGKYLVENTCDNGKVNVSLIDCPVGCLNGRCLIETSCKDSEGRNSKENYYRGRLVINSTRWLRAFNDYCTNDLNTLKSANSGSYLVEYACSESGSIAQVVKCKGGCSFGACKQSYDKNKRAVYSDEIVKSFYLNESKYISKQGINLIGVSEQRVKSDLLSAGGLLFLRSKVDAPISSSVLDIKGYSYTYSDKLPNGRALTRNISIYKDENTKQIMNFPFWFRPNELIREAGYVFEYPNIYSVLSKYYLVTPDNELYGQYYPLMFESSYNPELFAFDVLGAIAPAALEMSPLRIVVYNIFGATISEDYLLDFYTGGFKSKSGRRDSLNEIYNLSRDWASNYTRRDAQKIITFEKEPLSYTDANGNEIRVRPESRVAFLLTFNSRDNFGTQKISASCVFGKIDSSGKIIKNNDAQAPCYTVEKNQFMNTSEFNCLLFPTPIGSQTLKVCPDSDGSYSYY